MPRPHDVTRLFAIVSALSLLLLALAAYLTRTRPPVLLTAPAGPMVSVAAAVAQVDVRDHVLATFEPAETGAELPVGGQLRTGPAARVRLDYDGRSLLVGADSLLTLERFGGSNDVLVARLRLMYGRLVARLEDGRLELETPLGLVTVTGPLAEVEYSPGADRNASRDDVLVVRCFEGQCTYANSVRLATLQQLAVINDGLTILGPAVLTAADVQVFEANNPDFDGPGPALTARATDTPDPNRSLQLQPTPRRLMLASPTSAPATEPSAAVPAAPTRTQPLTAIPGLPALTTLLPPIVTTALP